MTCMRLILAVIFLWATSHLVFAAGRTFASLTTTPSATNITAGAGFTASVALATKASSGSTASGPVVVYVDHISPSAPGIITSIDPSASDIATSTTNDSMLTVTTALTIPANTYTIFVVANTNANNSQTNVTPLTNTFTLTVASAAADVFSMSLSPASTDVIAGIATNVSATVSFLDYSTTISGTVTNSVIVSPAGQGVTASLNSNYAPITNHFGQTNLLLTMTVAANATPGTYNVIVTGTNSNFTANSPTPGIASVTNLFTVTDMNSFFMSVLPASARVFAGNANSMTAAVTLTDNSPVMSGVVTNGVMVSPSGQGVTANLNASLVSINPGGGQGSLTLTINTTDNVVPGIYQVIVSSTNDNFTANSPLPGIASVTNFLTVATPPSFQSVNMSGTNLIIAGTNGIPYAIYIVVASTNLALPMTQWMPILTNAFDASGSFIASVGLTNAITPVGAQQFFTMLQTTNLVPAVATPTFNPMAAPYFAEQPVTITSATSGASIRYTTDGTTPTETYGTLYSGPVTMQQPVNTNTSGFLSNCSGVTMLKAIAYKSGLPDSAVFTGNYEIIVPPPQTNSSPLCGLAEIAYHVTSLAAMRSFYEDYLGFAEPFLLPNSNTVAVIKINDQQYIELFQGALDPNQYQLISYGYQVTNAEVYREQLAGNGVAVSPSVTTNFLGNLSFFSVDPDGHTNEWVQYLTNSLTGRTQGQAMPGTQVYGYMFAFGGFTTNSANVYNYLVNQCGFDSGKHTDIHIPNNNGFFETLAVLNPQDQQNAGKTDKIDLLNFRGMTSAQSVAILTNRNPSIFINVYTNGSASSLENLAGDVYNPDLSRLELDDCWVQ
jgi:Fn3 associated